MNAGDIAALNLENGTSVDLTTAVDEATVRKVTALRVVKYDIPRGSCAAYYPETNPLFPLDHHDAKSKTPSYKLLPVVVTRSAEKPCD